MMNRPNLPDWIMTIPLGRESRKPLCCYPKSKAEELASWPKVNNAGAGILTRLSGLMILDLDVGHGVSVDPAKLVETNGIKSLVVYLTTVKGFTDTEARQVIKANPVLVRTRRGGLQLYYKQPVGVQGSPTSILPGVDVRGDSGDGMGRIPPTPGYEWLRSDWDRLTVAPDWLIELVRDRRAQKKTKRVLAVRDPFTPEPHKYMTLKAEDGTEGTAKELLLMFPESVKVEVHCPCHVDNDPSAVVFRPVGRGRITLSCSSCGGSWNVGRVL